MLIISLVSIESLSVKGNPNKGLLLLSLKLLSIYLAVLIADSKEFCITAFKDEFTELICFICIFVNSSTEIIFFLNVSSKSCIG